MCLGETVKIEVRKAARQGEERINGFMDVKHENLLKVGATEERKEKMKREDGDAKKTENTVRPSAVGDSSDKSKTANPEKYESK